MTAQSPMMMRCERCRAAISTTEATELIRLGVPCGVCGGTLTLCGGGLEHLGGDPASAIYELECAGYRIERAYADASIGRRRFLGYRLWQVSQQSSGGHPARG